VNVNIAGGSAGNVGGRNVTFTAFAPTTTWSQLYWGPASNALPRASLNNSLVTLSFVSISGTMATWQGNSNWVNPDTGLSHSVPIQMRVTITGLGATPWVTSGSVSGLDPGPGTGIGAVVNNISQVDFTANVAFLADIPTDGSGYIAINTVRNTGGFTLTSFTGGFYSAAP
jgi:hypothetical protein